MNEIYETECQFNTPCTRQNRPDTKNACTRVLQLMVNLFAQLSSRKSSEKATGTMVYSSEK